MQTIGLNRDTTDKFYTSRSIASECIELVKTHLDVRREHLIIEPSAGNGSFISGIKSLVDNYYFFDIAPENSEIERLDYLQYQYNGVYPRVHVVGNPPFGRQSSLAIRFIKKSVEFCDTISFILPRSFKKDSLQSSFPLNFHLVYQWDIPRDSFLVNTVVYDVPCVFQIWERRNYNRPQRVKSIPQGFAFVKRDENPHISFRRVGVNAGKIDRDINKSIQSHYFIRFNIDDSSDNFESLICDIVSRLSLIDFESDNTVGPRSISKTELTEKFNEILNL